MARKRDEKKNYKILLFLSDLKTGQEKSYACPEGDPVPGIQTWEAPVRYLLRKYRPDECELLCLVTEQAEDSYEWLQTMIGDGSLPPVQTQKIPYRPGEDLRKALPAEASPGETSPGENSTGESTLDRLLQYFSEPDCKLLLELTGGLRDTVMQLLLISRVLSYKGVPTLEAIYANHQEARIEDRSQLLYLFDLVAGLQEFTSFGSADTLRRYYETLAQITPEPMEPCVTELLDAIGQLTNTITLCRTGLLEDSLRRFRKALERIETSQDPFMRQFTSVFSQKYGKLDIPDVIRWCIRNGMYQQALTIYTERIPAYISNPNEGNLIYMNEKIWDNRNSYQDPAAAQFYFGFLRVGSRIRKHVRPEDLLQAPAGAPESEDDRKQRQAAEGQILTVKYLEDCLNRSWITRDYDKTASCTIPQLKKVMMDYLYIKALRNMVNHASDEGTTDQNLIRFLKANRYPALETVALQDVHRILEDALKNLQPQHAKSF